MIELMCLKELMLTKPMHEKNLIFLIIGILNILVLNMNNIFAMVAINDFIQKARNFKYVAIVSVKRIDYIIQFWYMSKNDAINIMSNSNLNKKSGLL